MAAALGRRKTMPPFTAQAAMMLREARVEVLTAAQAVSKAANIEPDFAATIGAADYMNNLEATFNLGVLFPLIGAFLASIYARIVYIKDDPSHFQDLLCCLYVVCICELRRARGSQDRCCVRNRGTWSGPAVCCVRARPPALVRSDTGG